MSNFDNTHLSIDIVENTKLVHRDYIAHCHRWTFVCRWLYQTDKYFSQKGARYLSANILDFGCGKDLPLYKTICSNKFGALPSYIGVDINKLELPSKFAGRKVKCTLYGERDLQSLSDNEIDNANIFTSFEVLEHVPAAYAKSSIEFIHNKLPENGYFIVSTPCWDEKIGAAGNHINEMKREALGYLFEETGFEIRENYGTFASEKDYKEYLTPEQLQVFKELQSYYNSHYLSTIFAPMFPQYSRNNLWVLRKANNLSPRLFPNKPETQWASGEDWRELL